MLVETSFNQHLNYFNPRYACAYHPEGYLGPARAGRKVAKATLLQMFSKSAFAGFLVEGWEVFSGFLHHSYDLVE